MMLSAMWERANRVCALVAMLSVIGQPVFAKPPGHGRPNDPLFPEQWGLENTGQDVVNNFGELLAIGDPGADVGAVGAWKVATGSKKIVVAVIDTGIDYTHPDLARNVWSAPKAFTVSIGGVTVNCPKGSHGVDVLLETCDPMDTEFVGHGTHSAGITQELKAAILDHVDVIPALIGFNATDGRLNVDAAIRSCAKGKKGRH